MNTIACEKCSATISSAAKECPKCWHPTFRNRGNCRVCGTILARSRHRYEAYSNYVVNGTTSSNKHIRHLPCTNCGEPMPLRQSTDTFFGQMVFWIKFFIAIAVIGIGYQFVFGDETKIKSKAGKSSAALSSQTAIDLSGKWVGKFIYTQGLETQFTMNLTASQEVLSGSLTETAPKTGQPVTSSLSGSIRNNHKIYFSQDFGAQYPIAKCDADYDSTSKIMAGKCTAAGQSASFTAHLL